MSFINFNGKILEESSSLVSAQNRGLRYGDGIFETLPFYNGEPALWQEHTERLFYGMQKLQFDVPAHFTKEYLQEEALRLLKKNGHNNGRTRVRINVLRGNGGLFDPENMHPHFIMESWPVPPQYELNNNGLCLGIYTEASKPCDSFSNLKHNNFLPYTMGAFFARQNKYNDAVILNQYGRIADTCIANIFIIRNKEIFTPGLNEGCIAGIVRNVLIKSLPKIGYPVHETAVTVNDLLSADEIFLTNSMSPVKWVSSLQDNYYSNRQILTIYDQLPVLLPEYFQ